MVSWTERLDELMMLAQMVKPRRGEMEALAMIKMETGLRHHVTIRFLLIRFVTNQRTQGHIVRRTLRRRLLRR